ncbi:cation:proton antiporter [Niveispirillum lacus]|uniref:cation:proton antiporter n=1 Tax=Niveispirillum lacus TaxID=1981099 RepID=UPI0013FD828F|nr:cation:proton antiporter [Niveispirillum lacus]
MQHHFDLTGIAIVTSVALLCGLALSRLKQPAIVGYIVAGIVLGPGGFGLVSPSDSISALAELGVLMLLFLVGMELSVKAFQAVWKVALAAVVCQVGLSLLVTGLAGLLLGWPWPRAIVMGFVMALSGTAVAIKMLDDMGELKTETGRVTVGVLIAQDLAFVPLLLITQGMGSGAGLSAAVFAKLVAAMAALGGLVWFLSRRDRLIVPYGDWFKRNHEVIPLAAMAFCFTMAAATGVIGLSAAFGAFAAGFMLGNSDGRALALRATHPIQSVLIVVFFLSIGLMIDLSFVWSHLGEVLLLLFAVTALKSAINVGTLHLLGEPWERAFPAGVIMGSLGEFSFVLAAAGLSIGAIDRNAQQMAVTVIALSWLFSPIWLVSARRFHVLAEGGIGSMRGALKQVYRGEIAMINRVGGAMLRAAAATLDAVLRLLGRR